MKKEEVYPRGSGSEFRHVILSSTNFFENKTRFVQNSRGEYPNGGTDMYTGMILMLFFSQEMRIEPLL